MSRPRTPDPLLDDLDDEQRRAVTERTLPLAIHAGAGSGKTRVLTRRIAWRAREGLHDPDHVLAVTFTRKAATELASRLRRLGVAGSCTANTIHAIALAQLRRRALDHGRTPPEVLERKVRLLVPIVGGRGPAATLAASEVATEIEWAKTRLLLPLEYPAAARAAGRAPSRPLEEIAELYEEYEHEKRRRRLADFEDLVWWCGDALERDAEFAVALRWRFRHFFVDEFQDTSPAQLRLLRALLGDRPDVCVVGDPDQAIYGFAGAEASYLAAFPRHFPGGRVLRLHTNYRSTPEIVRAAGALLADAGHSRPRIRATAPGGEPPTITEYEDEEAEARGVAARCRDAHGPGRPWSAMAVLYRTNAQSALFEEAFGRAGIPVRVRGAARFLDRPEVTLALGELQRAAGRERGVPFSSLLETLAHRARPSEEQREHLDALVRLGHEYLDGEGPQASVEGFLAFLATSLRDDVPDGRDAVELLTFHRAKGLEFDTVFVTGLERGLVPIAHAQAPAQRAEERRLLYVALTRARRHLHLSFARQRTVGARRVGRAPSPWLAPIAASSAPATEGRADPAAALRASRQHLVSGASSAPDDPADAELFRALAEWRRRLARASAVPAYVIFSDATLRALARARPATRDALLAIPGIGPVKAERHGDAVLGIIARHSSPAPTR